MWAAKKLMEMKVAKRDEKFRDHDGKPNLVARIRATAKKQTMEILGITVGSKGRDARKFYVIRESAPDIQGPMRLYCSCPAQHYFVGFGRPCKHIVKLIAEIMTMAKDGTTSTKDVMLYDPEAIARACEVLGRADMAGELRKAV